MSNTQINITVNGKKTLATAGKYCDRNIDINVEVQGFDSDVKEFSQMNANVTAYLASADAAYTDSNSGSVSVIDNYRAVGQDRPDGYPLSTSGKIVYLQNEETGDGSIVPVANSTNSIFNANPGEVSRYIVVDRDGKPIENGRIKPTGRVKMIRFYAYVRNCRDLGGWSCDGGTVKYGLLYRSGVPSTTEPLDIKLAKMLDIRRQIDFRGDEEANYRTESCFGSNVRYERIPLDTYYDDIVNPDGANYSNTLRIFGTILDAVIHNEPTLFNCSLGRDRTGTIAFMILALLGVSRADIDKDFELSAFSYEDITANRTGASYIALADYVSTMGASNLRDNVVKWFLNAGFTIEQLNTFRVAMIDGTPDVLTDKPKYTNLVPTATTAPYGDEIFNGVGYQNGKHVSSSGSSSYSNNTQGCVATGNIPVTVGYRDFPTIYIKGITIDTSVSGCRFYFNHTSGACFSVNMFSSPDNATFTQLGDQYYKLEFVKDDSGQFIVTKDKLTTGDISFRLSGVGDGKNLIVTINEPIE